METDRSIFPDVELRIEPAENGGQRLIGTSPVYETESVPIRENGVEFIEVVRRGAATESLARGDEVKARIEHRGGLNTIGRTTSGTLRLSETDEGVRYEVDLPDTTAARDLAELVRREDLTGSSFAFRVSDPEEDQVWHERDDGVLVRELVKLALRDVAPTGDPAYLDAQVKLRSLEASRARRGSGHRARNLLRLLELRERERARRS